MKYLSNDYDDEDNEEQKDFPLDKKKKKDRIIWSKGPDWNEIFGSDIFKDIDMADIEKMIGQFMDQFNPSKDKDDTKGPVVWGFSMTIGPDKKPIIRPFGKIDPKNKKLQIKAKNKFLVDVIEESSEIIVIAEIPGVTDADIILKPTATALKIMVDAPKHKYFNEIPLPTEVYPKSATKHYQNGILEVKLKKKNSNKEGSSILVE